MLNGNLFNRAILYFLIFFILVLIGALLDLNAQGICLVTVDPKTNKNMIVWTTENDTSVNKYLVLKETTRGGIYSTVGTVVYANAGKYIDSSSNPSQNANRYKIVSLTNADSDTSDFHQTIHLVISKGLPGTYNLIWTPYIGFEYETYYIYKGYAADKMFLFDSLANTYNTYTDSSDRITYYQIGVRKRNPCYVSKLKSNREPISQSVSNLEDNIRFFDAIDDKYLNNKIKVYPNPFSNHLTIDLYIDEPEVVKLEFFNQLGETAHTYTSGSVFSGNFRYVVPENICRQSNSFLIARVVLGDKAYYAKILKMY